MKILSYLLLTTVALSLPQGNSVLQTHQDKELPKAASTVLFKELVIGRVHSGDSIGTCFPIQRLPKLVEKTSSIKPEIRDRLRLLTDRHVVAPHWLPGDKPPAAERVELFIGAKKIYEIKSVRIVKDSKELDSCLIEIQIPRDLKVPILILSKNSPRVGAEVFSFGCAVGIMPVFTNGYVCRKAGEDFHMKDSWICSANVFGGSSGGPIIDKRTGMVVGVTIAYPQGYGRDAKGRLTVIPVTFVHIFMDASKVREWLLKK